MRFVDLHSKPAKWNLMTVFLRDNFAFIKFRNYRNANEAVEHFTRNKVKEIGEVEKAQGSRSKKGARSHSNKKYEDLDSKMCLQEEWKLEHVSQNYCSHNNFEFDTLLDKAKKHLLKINFKKWIKPNEKIKKFF